MPEIIDEYLTLAEESEGLYKEKGSKFIARAFPVNDEDEVKNILEILKKQFHDARHHCYAYRIGLNDDRFRMNDDGEPSGTAGRPIYGQILSKNLCNVLIVVIRYFGGTKLGASGLANAYKQAARDALENALIIKEIITETIFLHFNYQILNEVMRIIKENKLDIESQDFTLDCRIALKTRLREKDRIYEIFDKIHGVTIEN